MAKFKVGDKVYYENDRNNTYEVSFITFDSKLKLKGINHEYNMRDFTLVEEEEESLETQKMQQQYHFRVPHMQMIDAKKIYSELTEDSPLCIINRGDNLYAASIHDTIARKAMILGGDFIDDLRSFDRSLNGRWVSKVELEGLWSLVSTIKNAEIPADKLAEENVIVTFPKV